MKARIKTVRSFNRSYMQRILGLTEQTFNSPFSLTEVRILHEISERGEVTATELCKSLSIDGGYLSRILNQFEKQDIIVKERSAKDARQRKISFTKNGEKTYRQISKNIDDIVGDMLTPLSDEQQETLVNAMHAIGAILALDMVAAA